jgi:hypothetical protein
MVLPAKAPVGVPETPTYTRVVVLEENKLVDQLGMK